MNGRAAFICRHVTESGLPVLRARYDVPVDDADSGWQFSCNMNPEDESTAVLCALDEVLQQDSSLKALLTSPKTPGEALVRQSSSSPWNAQPSHE